MALRDFSSDSKGLALNTATLGQNMPALVPPKDPMQIVDACAARGFGGIVFWRPEVGDAQALGDYVRAAGMRVDGLCRTPFLTGRDAGSDDELRASVDMAAALGAPVLTIVTGGTDPGTKGLADSQKRLAERAAWAADYAHDRGVNLALEPLNPMFGGNRSCLFTVAEANAICAAVDKPNLGVAVDVYHVWWDTGLADSLAAAGDRIFGFHLCDWLEDTSDMLLDRGMMGDGVADLRGLRAWVEAAGYAGPCEVEIFSRHWWGRPMDEVLDTVKERFMACC